MAVIALASATGSPGVTTTSLALTLSWPRPVLLVEADPAGGDILAGFLRAELRADRGLAYLSVAARRDGLAEEFAAQVIDLGQRKSPITRLLLAGVSDPAESAGVAQSWPQLADFFARLGGDGRRAAEDPVREALDVIVDCGRVVTHYPPLPILAAADAVLLVLRSTLRSVSGTAPVMAGLRRDIARAGGDADRIGLLVIEAGEYRSADLAHALAAPVVATVPWRDREAAALSDGAGRVSEGMPLLRSAGTIGEALIREITRARAAAAGPQPGQAPSLPPGPARR